MFMRTGGPDKLYRKERRSHVSQDDLAKGMCFQRSPNYLTGRKILCGDGWCGRMLLTGDHKHRGRKGRLRASFLREGGLVGQAQSTVGLCRRVLSPELVFASSAHCCLRQVSD